jgi:hypothetical protein
MNDNTNIDIGTVDISINVAGDWIQNIVLGVPVGPLYTVSVRQLAGASRGDDMADKSAKAGPGKNIPRSTPRPGGNGITLGGQGTFVAQLNNNSVPISLPSGSSWQWSDDDPNSTITMDPTDTTGGTVIITVPSTDTATQLTVTAATIDPNGNAVSGSLLVPLSPGVNIFTVTVTQTA